MPEPPAGGMVKLKDLADAGSARIIRGSGNTQIKDLVYHSSEVSPGSLFFAIQGQTDDGKKYVKEAVRKGHPRSRQLHRAVRHRPHCIHVKALCDRLSHSATFQGVASRVEENVDARVEGGGALVNIFRGKVARAASG